MTQITVTLPDSLVEQVKYFGQVTQRDITSVLADTLEMMWPSWELAFKKQPHPIVEQLSDTEVVALAEAKMDSQQVERLGKLQTKGKTEGLNSSEQFELLLLLHFYQVGQLRKSQALAEAVRRGIRKPLSA